MNVHGKADVFSRQNHFSFEIDIKDRSAMPRVPRPRRLFNEIEQMIEHPIRTLGSWLPGTSGSQERPGGARDRHQQQGLQPFQQNVRSQPNVMAPWSTSFDPFLANAFRMPQMMMPQDWQQEMGLKMDMEEVLKMISQFLISDTDCYLQSQTQVNMLARCVCDADRQRHCCPI